MDVAQAVVVSVEEIVVAVEAASVIVVVAAVVVASAIAVVVAVVAVSAEIAVDAVDVEVAEVAVEASVLEPRLLSSPIPVSQESSSPVAKMISFLLRTLPLESPCTTKSVSLLK